MNTKPTFVVQIADREWTLEALHCACLLARNTSAQIALIKMIPVPHAGWLGTEWGYMKFTDQDEADFTDYQATLEDYGVEFAPLLFQYITLAEAMADVAVYVNAQIVFAKIPESIIPFWTTVQRWLLGRQFAQQNRQWVQYPVYEVGASQPIPEAMAEIHHH